MTIRDFAARAGFASHNYPAKRNRDELPYTVDDLELICRLFDVDPWTFVQTAYDNHAERIEWELDVLTDGPARRRALRASQVPLDLAAALEQASARELTAQRDEQARASADEPRLRAVAQEGELEGSGEESDT